jgi:hypothetical protein
MMRTLFIALFLARTALAGDTNLFLLYHDHTAFRELQIDSSKAASVTNGVTLGQVVTNLGPGFFYGNPSMGVQMIGWDFSDGRKLYIRPASDSPSVVLHSDIHSDSRFWFTTNAYIVSANMAGTATTRYEFTNLTVLTGSTELRTLQSFRLPVEITIVAKTDSTNLRLAYAADQIIFNWEADQSQFRVDGGPGDGHHAMGKGKIPSEKYVMIKWVVTSNHQAVYVDGELRFEHEGDYSQIERPISVFPANGSTVTVKSIEVKRIADTIDKCLVEVIFAGDDKPPTTSFHEVDHLWISEKNRGRDFDYYGWADHGGWEADADTPKKAAECRKLLQTIVEPKQLPDSPNKIVTVKCADGDATIIKRFPIDAVPPEVHQILTIMGFPDSAFSRLKFVKK